MNEEKGSGNSLSRRSFLSHTVAAAALVSAVDPKNPAGAQTPTVTGRIRESFDFGWKFIKGDIPGAHQPSFSDTDWRNLDLPHDWSIEGPYGEKEPAAGSGGYLPTGIGWYRKHFRLPATHKDHKILIHFDGIYENSEIWINGRFLGKRPFGYISFWHDLTPHLAFSGDNLLAVRVDNSHQPNSRWYSGSCLRCRPRISSERRTCQDEWRLPASRWRCGGRRRTGTDLGTAPGTA
jgi:beta-galactosidase